MNLEVASGQTFNSVLNKLGQEQQGFPLSVAKFHIKLQGLGKSLKTGEYLFKKGESLEVVLRALSTGRVIKYKLTIPEGYNMFEIADLLVKSKIVNSRKAFLDITRSSKAAQEFLGFEAPRLEGYLYPSTYEFSKSMAPYLIVKTLTKTHLKIFNEIKAEVGQLPEGFDHRKLVTLASVVEKETGASFERPMIASVFLNRLRKRMKLQSDPTTIYAEWLKTGERLKNIRKKHLLAKNDYNTYSVRALPLGPISNPGKEAMLAICRPKVGDFLYFVSKNDGTHYFSKTYAEHNKAVRRYQLSKKARAGKSWRNLKQKKTGG